ncbi:hypothetical protein ACO0LF_17120 [Undibacterium sp. Di27W]|uniref:hypothetical protein n=1 Tax=Undibacterium sp. Di27W TaxID=3413036 RepID=UPI003BF142EB
MNQSKVLYFQETYSKMRDDELAYLIATGGDGLVEEAQMALTKVLQTRDLKSIETEVALTANDLNSQAAFKFQQMRKQEQLNASLRKAWHVFCAAFLISGIVLLIFDDYERGPFFVAAGLIGSALFELRRLAVRFIVAIFTMN